MNPFDPKQVYTQRRTQAFLSRSKLPHTWDAGCRSCFFLGMLQYAGSCGSCPAMRIRSCFVPSFTRYLSSQHFLPNTLNFSTKGPSTRRVWRFRTSYPSGSTGPRSPYGALQLRRLNSQPCCSGTHLPAADVPWLPLGAVTCPVKEEHGSQMFEAF